MNSLRSLFHPDNHDDTNQHLLKTHEPKKRDNTIKKSVTIKDPMTGSSNALPYIDNTSILARPSSSDHPAITPLNNLNRTPEGGAVQCSRATLPVNELYQTPPERGRPDSNLHGCKHAFADVSTNTSENSPISHSQPSHSSKARANENTIVETSIRRMNEEISELEDQSVNIYTEVKKISYNVSLINTRQLELFSRLENIEDLMKQIDKYFTG
jgi:uncharacterized protein (UPF0335 family)